MYSAAYKKTKCFYSLTVISRKEKIALRVIRLYYTSVV